MNQYVFAEIDLSKRCFRVHRINAKTKVEAHAMLPINGWGIGFIGVKETSSKKTGRKTSLVKSRTDWQILCEQFSLTAEQGEKAISKATTG